MQTDLKQFMEHLLRVVRDSFSTYGKDANFPNTDSTQKAVGYRLQAAALAFARAYGTQSVTREMLMRQAREVEGYLRTGQALSTLSEKETETLVGALYDLVEGRAR